MNDLLAWIFNLLVIVPVQNQLAESLGSAPSPQVMQASQSCLTAETPRLLQKAGSDWNWTMTTAVGFWTGTVKLVDLVGTSNADYQTLLKVLALTSAGES